MRKKARWIAAGLAAAMCATATMGAVSLAEEQSEPVEAVEEEAPAETEAPEEEAAETEAPEEEAAEAEASDEEEATEAETETEKSSKKKKKETEEEETETETETEAEVEYVSVSFENEDVWEELTIPNGDLVETAVNIHSGADEDSEILGYLYSGSAAWIIETVDEWTEIYSNGLTGFVLSEYLLTGDDVAGVADYYGIEGVRAEWDGVIVYATDEAVDELSVMNAGDVYPVINYGEHWDEIQYDKETLAYVSAEDVSNVLIFAPATLKNGERTELEEVYEGSEGDTEEYFEDENLDEEYYEDDYYEDDFYEDYYYEDYYEDDYYYDDYSDSYYDNSADYYYEEPSYTEPAYTAPAYTEPSYSYSGSSSVGSSSSTGSSDYGTTYETQAETQAQTQAETQAQTQAETEAPADTGTASSSDNIGGAYYDANTDTYYDDDGNEVVSYSYTYTDDYTEEYTDDYTTYSIDTYAEEPYWEETYEEEVSYGSTAGSDDTTLLAALIYCEAGNQPYDGMVAVGAVVMNRVYSGSFPNSISEVIYESGQFTPASSGALASALASGVGDTYYAAAADALAGSDPTGGALYFNTSHGSGVHIGDHWFY